MTNTPFSDVLLRDWLFIRVNLPEVEEFSEDLEEHERLYVQLEGSGPFELHEFQAFVNKSDVFWASQLGDSPAALILVLGRDGWDEQKLLNVIQFIRRINFEFRIYSQEMFLAHMLTGCDPYDAGRVIVERFWGDHPAFAFLSTVGFPWPSTYATTSDNLEQNEKLQGVPETGLLKHFGYKVGESGVIDLIQRRKILSRVYLATQLPALNSSEYIRQWGTPGSAQRLSKIANSIAAFCRSAKRKWNPPELAIEHWESDLEWLKREYYLGRYDFYWPSID